MRLAKKQRYAPLGMVTPCRPGSVGRTIRPDHAPFIRLGLMFMCVSLRNCVLFSTVHTTAPQRTEWDDPLSAKLSLRTHGMSSSTPMSAPYWKTPRRFARAVSRARLYRMGAPLVGNESPASTRLTPVDTNWSDALLQVYTSTSRRAPLRPLCTTSNTRPAYLTPGMNQGEITERLDHALGKCIAWPREGAIFHDRH